MRGRLPRMKEPPCSIIVPRRHRQRRSASLLSARGGRGGSTRGVVLGLPLSSDPPRDRPAPGLAGGVLEALDSKRFRQRRAGAHVHHLRVRVRREGRKALGDLSGYQGSDQVTLTVLSWAQEMNAVAVEDPGHRRCTIRRRPSSSRTPTESRCRALPRSRPRARPSAGRGVHQRLRAHGYQHCHGSHVHHKEDYTAPVLPLVFTDHFSITLKPGSTSHSSAARLRADFARGGRATTVVSAPAFVYEHVGQHAGVRGFRQRASRGARRGTPTISRSTSPARKGTATRYSTTAASRWTERGVAAASSPHRARTP